MVASGTIVALFAGGFTLNAGSSYGSIHAYTATTTQFFGARPYVGESVYVNGTGSWSTSIQATTVAQSSAVIQTAGTISTLIAHGFTLQTGPVHGSIHVYLTAATALSGAATAGAKVQVVGAGSWSTSLTAMSVSSASTPSPGTSTTPLEPQAQAGVGLFQVFDAWGTPRISSSEAVADGSRYGVVWGARAGMPASWRAGNPQIVASYYLPMETDANTALWGAIGHSLSWWQLNHPDWVLYSCTSSGTPTTTPAMISGLPDNVPLDIHNPDVISYQVKLAANYAIANGYNGLAIDEVIFYDIDGANAAGSYGCGIYQSGTFIRRYSSARDANWNADVVAWVKAARAILTTDPVIGPHHLKLIVNHPAGAITNADEQAILANVDADLDETGYSDYGYYPSSSSLFKLTTDWMNYAQAHGVSPLIVNKFAGTALTPDQIEYSIATYLMGNEGGAGLFTSNSDGYGVEQYVAQYATKFGTRCGGYYGGPSYSSTSPDIWYRRYSNALVVVNSGSPTLASEVATLPSGHTYTDLEGRPIANPLKVAKADAYVLLTSNGCD